MHILTQYDFECLSLFLSGIKSGECDCVDSLIDSCEYWAGWLLELPANRHIGRASGILTRMAIDARKYKGDGDFIKRDADHVYGYICAYTDGVPPHHDFRPYNYMGQILPSVGHSAPGTAWQGFTPAPPPNPNQTP